jgi:amino acid adenylation domain-containing protein
MQAHYRDSSNCCSGQELGWLIIRGYVIKADAERNESKVELAFMPPSHPSSSSFEVPVIGVDATPRRDRAPSFLGNTACMLLATAAVAADRPAVVDGDQTISYADLAARSLAIASGLQRAGIEPGDRVAVLLQRGSDAAAAFFGVLASGAITVTVNESLRPRQIEYILRHAEAAALVTSADMLARLSRTLETTARILDVEAIPSSGNVEPVPRVGSDVAQIIYTSGSTGLPKGVTVSHGNLWAGMRAVVHYVGINDNDRVASLLPFSFDYGLNQLLCCAGTGATLVVERSPIPHRILEMLRAGEVTVLPAVPPLWLQLLTVQAFRDRYLPSLRVMTNTGGRLPVDAVRTLRRCQPHADLVLMYGLTEAFRSTYLMPGLVDRKPGAIGRAIPGAEILVLDEKLEPCKPGETGQLVHRGATVALGYWRDPEATSKVFRPHPLRPPGTPDSERVVFSGDLVYQDEEGDLFFVSREDKLIKTLGYRVSPDEVADVLYASGEVVEALVASEPDDVRGARIVAYVVLADGGQLDRLKTFCASELPRYMQPSRIEVRSALSRTPSGKHDPAATAERLDDRT